MKKTLLFLFTIFTFSAATAQGNNLQFNRALYENYSVNTNSYNQYHLTSNAFTVPVGKVWKVTFLSGSMSQTSPVVSHDVGISKSGVNAFSSNLSDSQNILWLPAGSYDIRVRSGSNYGFYNFVLSGIEFNLVQ